MKRVEAFIGEFEEIISQRYRDISSPELRKNIADLIENVRENGDKALCEYTRQFDGYALTPEAIPVPPGQRDVEIEESLQKAIEHAITNIRSFHEKQLRNEWRDENPDGGIVGEIFRPVDRAGVYVPGGTAPLVSSVLMSVIPAQVAGVKEICVATPADAEGNVNSGILAACKACGVTEIYRGHGPSLIAAMAFGTDTIKKVDVIAGPGSAAVTEAKRQVYGYVALDLVAGPSESMIVIDESADPELVAVDILSQAEHHDSSTYIVSLSGLTLDRVDTHISSLLTTRFTDQSIKKAASEHLTGIHAKSLDEAAHVINLVAPEHLQLITEHNDELLDKIKHAGAIFLGPYAPVPLGDFIAGPSHVLPTGGTARYMSGLSTEVFIKRMSIMSCTRDSFGKMAQSLAEFGRAEQLPVHEYTARVRTKRQ
jgi:histidinol dehydrogenase